MDGKTLPLGVRTLRGIRGRGCRYVDKTAHAERLVDDVKHGFLSRPRGFGKTLFLDTLKELFEGNEKLFEGLAVHGRWDWSVRRPVVRLEFGEGDFAKPGGLDAVVAEQLAAAERQAEVERVCETAAGRLAHLLQALHERTGRRVALLVDDSDKPVTDALHVPDVARTNFAVLHGLYTVTKFGDAHVKFSFLTGVNNIARTNNLFRGLGNFVDVTLDRRHSTICGFTDAELDDVFTRELKGLDRDRIRERYGGYGWGGGERVCNPVSVLRLFREREFGTWWFEAGLPDHLADLFESRGVFAVDLEDVWQCRPELSRFDVEGTEPAALLHQGGWLAITESDRSFGTSFHRLSYPNREVRQALNGHILRGRVPEMANGAPARELAFLLGGADLAGLEELLRAFCGSVAADRRTRIPVDGCGKLWARSIYSFFAQTELDVRVEDVTDEGMLDIAVFTDQHPYLFGFQMTGSAAAGGALRRLRERNYAERFGDRALPVHFVEVEIDPGKRDVAAFETVFA